MFSAAAGDFSDRAEDAAAPRRARSKEGSSNAYAVANTSDDPIYSARRFGNFTYSIPVSNGTHTLRLYFADPSFTTTGRRKFNVIAEGRTILSNFDIVAAAGAGKKALTRTFTVNVTDGRLDLRFQSLVNNAIVSGIEVT